MIQSPYQPPSESAASSPPPESHPELAVSFFFKVSQFVSYGWLLILFLIWQQDGLNFLVQRDIARMASIVTGCVTLAVSAIYVRQRYETMKRRCVAYLVAAGLLQLGVVNTFANHSVERFPM